MTKLLRTQGERLYDVFAELVRAYQFRDRDQTCCRGLSVSQCYALETLLSNGPTTMSELARTLYLEASTVTRIIDRLVDADLVERTASDSDRRVCRVAVTDAGRRLVLRIRDDLIDEHVWVLQQVPTKSREAVITALDHLLDAFRTRQATPDCTGGDATAAGVAKTAKGR
jgi:DNA-binding MarR family transcriptional regulator